MLDCIDSTYDSMYNCSEAVALMTAQIPHELPETFCTWHGI